MDCSNLIKDLLIPTIMTIFLAYIAYQQLVTNRNKLKLDLYTKRFEVYSVSLTFYQELVDADGASKELLREFIKQKEAAKFLFSTDPTIYSLLNEMHKKSFQINALKQNKDNSVTKAEEVKYLQPKAREAMTWFDSAIKELSKKMEMFLNAK